MKDTRRLDITKQKKIRIYNGLPSKEEGKDGDMRICNTSFGVRLYCKTNNSWYYTSLNKEG